MTTPQERADGVIFDEARKAGFEDGNDFKVSDGPGSAVPGCRDGFTQILRS